MICSLIPSTQVVKIKLRHVFIPPQSICKGSAILIEFKNVSKTYDNGTRALKNVSLKINKGEFVFVVGSSGAGKSTFLKLIMHEEVPNSGSIIVNNHDLVTMRKKEIPYFRRTMGIVFQDFRLIPNMTVYDNVAFAMRVIGAYEKDIRKRVPYVLGLVGLGSKARNMPNQLSGGEQQRVALARALVNNAGLIVADEPTGNVDPEMSFEIVDLLNHINANGTTVVMVTHEHELVRSFKHRVIVVENGAITSDTGPEDLSTREENRRALDRKGRRNTYYHADETRARREQDFIRTYEPVAAARSTEQSDDNKEDASAKRKSARHGNKKHSLTDGIKKRIAPKPDKKKKEDALIPVQSESKPEQTPKTEPAPKAEPMHKTEPAPKTEPEQRTENEKKDPVKRADELFDSLKTGTSSDLFARDEEDKIDYSIYLEHLSEIGGDQDE